MNKSQTMLVSAVAAALAAGACSQFGCESRTEQTPPEPSLAWSDAPPWYDNSGLLVPAGARFGNERGDARESKRGGKKGDNGGKGSGGGAGGDSINPPRIPTPDSPPAKPEFKPKGSPSAEPTTRK